MLSVMLSPLCPQCVAAALTMTVKAGSRQQAPLFGQWPWAPGEDLRTCRVIPKVALQSGDPLCLLLSPLSVSPALSPSVPPPSLHLPFSVSLSLFSPSPPPSPPDWWSHSTAETSWERKELLHCPVPPHLFPALPFSLCCLVSSVVERGPVLTRHLAGMSCCQWERLDLPGALRLGLPGSPQSGSAPTWVTPDAP